MHVTTDSLQTFHRPSVAFNAHKFIAALVTYVYHVMAFWNVLKGKVSEEVCTRVCAWCRACVVVHKPLAPLSGVATQLSHLPSKQTNWFFAKNSPLAVFRASGPLNLKTLKLLRFACASSSNSRLANLLTLLLVAGRAECTCTCITRSLNEIVHTF